MLLNRQVPAALSAPMTSTTSRSSERLHPNRPQVVASNGDANSDEPLSDSVDLLQMLLPPPPPPPPAPIQPPSTVERPQETVAGNAVSSTVPVHRFHSATADRTSCYQTCRACAEEQQRQFRQRQQQQQQRGEDIYCRCPSRPDRCGVAAAADNSDDGGSSVYFNCVQYAPTSAGATWPHKPPPSQPGARSAAATQPPRDAANVSSKTSTSGRISSNLMESLRDGVTGGGGGKLECLIARNDIDEDIYELKRMRSAATAAAALNAKRAAADSRRRGSYVCCRCWPSTRRRRGAGLDRTTAAATTISLPTDTLQALRDQTNCASMAAKKANDGGFGLLSAKGRRRSNISGGGSGRRESVWRRVSG